MDMRGRISLKCVIKNLVELQDIFTYIANLLDQQLE